MINASDKTAPAASPFQTFSTSSVFRVATVFPKTKSESDNTNCFSFSASLLSFDSQEFFQKLNQTALATFRSWPPPSSSLESFSKNQIRIRQHQLLPVPSISSLFRVSRVFPKTKSESDSISCFLFPSPLLFFESREFFQKPNPNQTTPAASCSLHFIFLSSLESFSKNQI